MKKNTRDKNTIAADSAMLLDESPTPAPHALIRLQERPAFQADSVMLLDESPTPAPHALIRLQERPVFQLDDKKGSFATISDLDDNSDKIQAHDSPLTIRESKPN